MNPAEPRAILHIVRDTKSILALVPDPDHPNRKITAVAAAHRRLRDWATTRGYPTGSGGGSPSGEPNDATARAAIHWPTDTDADLDTPLPIRPHRDRTLELTYAELEDRLTRVRLDLAWIRDTTAAHTPLPIADLDDIHACENPRCEHVCTGQPASDRLRRWHGRTERVCPRCYQHLDAQHHADIPEDRCRYWPYDARPNRKATA